MHKTAQAWFSGSPSTSSDLLKPSPSLLADRNAYVEAAVRTADDKVSGTFNSKEVLARGLADDLPTLRPKAAVDQIPNSQTKMHKTAQAWFSSGPSTSNDLLKPSPSLLAGRNAYLEAAVRTADDKVSGTFNRVSKGVMDIPGNLQSASSSVPTGRSLVTFGALLAVGIFLVFIAFTVFLPVMVLVPQKFAIIFSIGCALLIASFFALKGPKNQLAHMSLKERLSFTLGIIGTMVGTIYVSIVLLISWNAFPVSNG